MSEFYYPLECGWDIVPVAMALVSNTPPQAGRVLRTTRVLYRYSAFVGGSMHPCAHDTGKTLTQADVSASEVCKKKRKKRKQIVDTSWFPASEVKDV